jgi:hypothetical protein
VVNTAEKNDVGKKMGRPKRSERADAVVKVDASLKGMAEMVAKRRGVPLAEYLSEILRSPVTRDFAKEMRLVEAESKLDPRKGGEA